MSLLNEKILIQKTVFYSDAIANRKNIWEDYHSYFAMISGEGGPEASAVWHDSGCGGYYIYDSLVREGIKHIEYRI